MINAIWGIKTLPFKREATLLLPQQKQAIEMIRIHAQQGGFSVIIGEPGVGKTVLREHIEACDKARDTTVVSCSRTMHTYRQIIWQLAEAFLLETKEKNLEADLIEAAF
uniref:AAA family ATPase n=1 Tax=Serratia microhaemolytica TaxID=2675110 RepID=UPI0012D7B838